MKIIRTKPREQTRVDDIDYGDFTLPVGWKQPARDAELPHLTDFQKSKIEQTKKEKVTHWEDGTLIDFGDEA